jgi:carboxyl-terminal processing protease
MHSRSKLILVTVSCCVVLFLMLGTVLGRGAGSDNVYSHLSVFTEVLSRIKSEYVEEPDMEDVTLGAVNGLLESIDPYASYLNREQYQQYVATIKNGSKGDVGLVLSRKVGYVSVVDAIPGSPAARAGIETGDIIETIDGVATRDMPLAYAEMLLRGEPGSQVRLTVLRVRESAEPQEIKLVREVVQFPPVRGQMLEGEIGHIRVQSLETGKSADVARQLEALVRQGARKIILDLRDSASGDVKEGLALADLFLDQGTIATLRGQKVERQEFSASREKTVCRLPLVVVINRGTARGAEVAAAALLENKRAEVVGERSYGDAALRRAVALDDGGAVILSVAKYYSPGGKAIQDTGVTPSVVAMAREPVSDSQLPIEPQPELPLQQDTILQKAIEVLTKGARMVAQEAGPGAGAPERPAHPLDVPGPRP